MVHFVALTGDFVGEIEECLDMCMIGNVIRSLPYGVDSKVGKGGVDLSSGEKQRLFIARAILRDPDLLVLGETTSNLDLQLERTLFASLQAWLRRLSLASGEATE